MMQLLNVLWFLIPAGVANLIPPIAARVMPNWSTPLDFGLHWRGRQLLGSHKTVRGLVIGTLMGALAHQVQVLLAHQSASLADLAVSPQFYQYWWLGAWLGFTALLGDALKSLVKRQLQIAPGRPWLPWDKFDWVLGCLAGSWFLLPLTPGFAVTALIAGLMLSTLGRIVGFWLSISDKWL
ncbi:MAG: CDP-archaeol synthase [Gammaproteobacteria bacterium]|nr:CDP-archaeol synthase [Pseudomonadales bacterium]MCP5345384.1 CDP-archaeol synthase [Pseudomonadales bacterium]